MLELIINQLHVDNNFNFLEKEYLCLFSYARVVHYYIKRIIYQAKWWMFLFLLLPNNLAMTFRQYDQINCAFLVFISGSLGYYISYNSHVRPKKCFSRTNMLISSFCWHTCALVYASFWVHNIVHTLTPLWILINCRKCKV